MTTEPLEQFANDIEQQVIYEASADGSEGFRREIFARHMTDHLARYGEISDPQVCHYSAGGMRLDAWAFDEDDGILSLVVCDYDPSAPLRRVSRSEVDRSFKRLENYFHKAVAGLHQQLEPASMAYDMTESLYRARAKIERLRLFVVTNGLMRARSDFGASVVEGRSASYHVWDLERFQQVENSGEEREAIELRLSDRFDEPLRCLVAPPVDGQYQAFLALFPGAMLQTIYDTYGPRLLEYNVRSFLQARGKVNAEMKKTLKSQPEMFLAYNNGITATAEEVDFEYCNGEAVITRLKGLQIVNGGQTTASIHNAVRKEGADVSTVYVQAKILLAPPERYHALVPNISKYSNTQNKVNNADFRANDPYHVELESLSRTVWAPAVGGSQKQTHWFYERARGQYQDEVNRQMTRPRMDEFRRVHPPEQKFTKTDLAKFENTWNLRPHIVSRGAEKNFIDFNDLVTAARPAVTLAHFQDLVAKAILFRCSEKIVAALNLGGYRANVVTYSLAYIARTHRTSIDLPAIWKEQDIPRPLADAISVVAIRVYDAITADAAGRNVTEWCKREDCWRQVQQLTIPLALAATAIMPRSPVEGLQEAGESHAIEGLIQRLEAVPPDTWFALSVWGKESGALQPWQRSLAFSLGRNAKAQRSPTEKQAIQGVRILDIARNAGFELTY